jgi:uncharacterized membrane protein
MVDKMKEKISKTKSRIAVVFLLNILDAVLTFAGITFGFGEEANPLLVNTVGDPFKLVVVKILLPLVVLGIFAYRMNTCTERMAKVCNVAVWGLIVYYSIIMAMHLFCLGAVTYWLIYIR